VRACPTKYETRGRARTNLIWCGWCPECQVKLSQSKSNFDLLQGVNIGIGSSSRKMCRRPHIYERLVPGRAALRGKATPESRTRVPVDRLSAVRFAGRPASPRAQWGRSVGRVVRQEGFLGGTQRALLLAIALAKGPCVRSATRLSRCRTFDSRLPI